METYKTSSESIHKDHQLPWSALTCPKSYLGEELMRLRMVALNLKLERETEEYSKESQVMMKARLYKDHKRNNFSKRNQG
jgi:hypothetical protein